MVCKIMFWFSLFLFYDSLISCHNLLAILSRGYVCCRFISFIFIVCSSVDVRPLTPGLGPSQLVSEPTGLLVYELRIGLG